MLSLSPRFDLFHFEFPKDYFPDEILIKYDTLLTKNAGVIISSVDYINESIQGVALPGISDLLIEQPQISRNYQLSDLTTEASHNNSYLSSENIISKIDNKFTVTMRQNQGLLNYFFMYETIFHRYCRDIEFNNDADVFKIDILDEHGSIISAVRLFQPIINSIDGLEFSYNKQERQTETFNVEFAFNNIDFDFVV